MHPTEVRSRFSRRTLAMWMASSLALAGCGEAGGTESADPYAEQAQRLESLPDEGLASERRIIVYSNTSLQLYVVDKSGSHTLVANRAGPPVISPDRRQVAYAKLPDSWSAGEPVVSADLHVLDLKSGRSVQLTQGYDDTEPVWTPDGLNLLFQSTRRSGVASLWKVRANGGALDQLTNETCSGGDPSYIPNPASSSTVQWAPTERRIIVYSNTSRTNGDVRLIGFDRALAVRTAYSLGVGHSPRWTEQGTVIYSRNEGDTVVDIEVSVE